MLNTSHYSDTAQKMKFSMKNFFSKCDQIRMKLRIWLDLLKNSLMENFIFCAVWDRRKWETYNTRNRFIHKLLKSYLSYDNSLARSYTTNKTAYQRFAFKSGDTFFPVPVLNLLLQETTFTVKASKNVFLFNKSVILSLTDTCEKLRSICGNVAFLKIHSENSRKIPRKQLRCLFKRKL